MKNDETCVRIGVISRKEFSNRNTYFTSMFDGIILAAKVGAPQGKYKAEIINSNSTMVACIGMKVENISLLLKKAYREAMEYNIE